VAAGVVYNDNLRLTRAPHDSVTGIDVAAGVGSVKETARSLDRLDALVNATNYSDHQEED